jgi:hypothetical protein
MTAEEEEEDAAFFAGDDATFSMAVFVDALNMAPGEPISANGAVITKPRQAAAAPKKPSALTGVWAVGGSFRTPICSSVTNAGLVGMGANASMATTTANTAMTLEILIFD